MSPQMKARNNTVYTASITGRLGLKGNLCESAMHIPSTTQWVLIWPGSAAEAGELSIAPLNVGPWQKFKARVIWSRFQMIEKHCTHWKMKFLERAVLESRSAAATLNFLGLLDYERCLWRECHPEAVSNDSGLFCFGWICWCSVTTSFGCFINN